LSESLASGVSVIGEIATVANRASILDPQSSLLGLTIFLEVIGFSKARAASVLAATAQRIEAARSGLLAPRRSLGLSPHAPYTVSPELLQNLIALASEQDLPVAMHLAESAEEIELLSAGTGPLQELLDERSMWDPSVLSRGSRPLDYLKWLSAAPRALVIHGNYLDGEEQAFLASHADRMSLVYCPRTHAYFGHPPYPLAQLLAAGVHVAMGTDSRASNPDLSVLGEMRHVARTHPDVAPSTILRLGTLSGAEALGRADRVGSLTPAKLAHLVAVPLVAAGGSKSTPEDLLAALLSAGDAPTGVWIGGQKEL
jgi:cytosine/adenosine deaminase-related metal-dependent hydrolase